MDARVILCGLRTTMWHYSTLCVCENKRKIPHGPFDVGCTVVRAEFVFS